jgi:hypothetical protein
MPYTGQNLIGLSRRMPPPTTTTKHRDPRLVVSSFLETDDFFLLAAIKNWLGMFATADDTAARADTSSAVASASAEADEARCQAADAVAAVKAEASAAVASASADEVRRQPAEAGLTRNVDCGIIVVLGNDDALKRLFCERLAAALHGGVLISEHLEAVWPETASTPARPAEANADAEHTSQLVRKAMGLDELREWPRRT